MQFDGPTNSTTVMASKFTELNRGWNAEPYAPHIAVNVDGATPTVSFCANPWRFPESVDGQIIKLRFTAAWRYAIGAVKNAGW